MATGRQILTTYFDLELDRRHSSSIKWAAPGRNLSADEAAADPLPMWVADMDFRSPPPVIEALDKAIRDGIFGYSFRTHGYEEAVCGWQKKRFGWDAKPQWLVQMPSVVTGLNLIIRVFSRAGDAILVQPPVYGHFFNDAVENGRQVVEAPLQLDERSRSYSFDADAFEAAITPKTKIFLLCNPHNPTGNVWQEADLRRMGEICLRHNILVVSDEIHQDLVFSPNRKHVPFASLGEEFADNSIVCTAPSKTFNLAGLKCSNLFIANEKRRGEVQRALVRGGMSFVNMLGAVACEAAYRDGEPWLDELLAYIRENHRHFAASVHQAIPALRVFGTDALYLAWMDCRGLGMSSPDLEKFLLTKARVWFDRGSKFGRQGDGFMRVNLGCPRSRVDEAVERMKAAFSGGEQDE
jgi:cystathionine beta-lyase